MAYKFPEKIFPSRVTPYLRCPFKFKCKNDDEIEVEFVERPSTFVGKVIHSVLENFFDISEVPMDRRDKVDIGGMVRKTWARVPKGGAREEFWTREERRELFGSEEQEKAYGLKTIRVLQNYLAQADLSVLPLSLEDWMGCEVGSFKLRGKIDRVDQLSEEKVAVWDYKTGSLPFHKDLRKIMEENLQIPIYSVIALESYAFAEEIQAGLIYVKHCRVFDVNWAREEVEELKEKLVKKLREMKKEKEFSPRPNKLCPWCDYKDLCPAYSEPEEEKVEKVSW